MIAAPLGDESAGYVWTVHDTSERARLERAKSEFVVTVSHELRSPLTSIKGFVELLERSPENMSERQREFVDIILRSTDRLRRPRQRPARRGPDRSRPGWDQPPPDRRRRGGAGITLDILMPGMDGFDVLRAIRSDPKPRTIPILFVSVFSDRHELTGEWLVSNPIDADELRHVLSAAVAAGRSRVLVVGREEMQPVLEPSLDELGIDHQWETSGAAAARVCGEQRFEVALVDAGIRSPQAVLQALDLRGRRLRRAVILFTDGVTPAPPGIERLGLDVVPVDRAAATLVAALRGKVGDSQLAGK